MLKFDIISVLPQLLYPHFDHLPFKRALLKNLIEINVVNLRDFALDSYGTVDDKPYGGGVGMILMLEPIYNAIISIYPEMAKYGLDNFLTEFVKKYPKDRIILLDPKGMRYVQSKAQQLTVCEHITFICGRYEGVDERVSKYLVTDSISVGDYVLAGGELPALTIMESVTRLIPGALEKEEAVQVESFSGDKKELEYPQYTRPEEFKGAKVPQILLSGHHKNIENWRKEQQKEQTIK
ncbi:tRNA (guanosine(37)-N1)-methyltransferase TrmD [candidate division WWE3 bacterium]|uniref:tRNA (guanine-N(1)-)-methyltransferase n=1 Tax=candidate division WWE3 bacterium TaxID=2053526 RepID=A0A7X9DL02_UNCKA|nr:tRNA (guanosine(37)-N1)-methyltransferase TrmD [candidate division WWE3 bacterium]